MEKIDHSFFCLNGTWSASWACSIFSFKRLLSSLISLPQTHTPPPHIIKCWIIITQRPGGGQTLVFLVVWRQLWHCLNIPSYSDSLIQWFSMFSDRITTDSTRGKWASVEMPRYLQAGQGTSCFFEMLSHHMLQQQWRLPVFPCKENQWAVAGWKMLPASFGHVFWY